MVEMNYLKEEEKTISKTFSKFAKELLLLTVDDEKWMTADRHVQFEALYDCLSDEENVEFISTSLVDNDLDNFTKMSQSLMAYVTITEKEFIALLSGQSLTNRIVSACDKKMIPPELVYRLKQCIWIYHMVQQSMT